MEHKEKNLEEIREFVREVLEEGHADKEMKKILKWAKRRLNCTVEDVKNGFKVCPPLNLTSECYTVHRSDKGIYDLQRFLAKAYGVTRQKVEQAYKSNRPL